MTTPLSYTIAFEGLLVVSAIMIGGWVYQYAKQDAGIVDILWSYSIGILALWYSIIAEAPLERKILIGGLAGLWSIRLGTYLLRDRLGRNHKTEDNRYRALRAHWGEQANYYFLPFFLAQAALSALLSTVYVSLLNNPSATLTVFEFFGAAVMIVAILGESIADRQLARFRSDVANRGKVCKVGLWNYSRHPNYFFEWLHWVGYVVMAIGTNTWWIPFCLMLVMYIFLTKLTGIPYTELQALKSRGDAYREYQRTTSVLIPWFPKKQSTRNGESTDAD